MELTSLAFCNLKFLLELEKDDVVLSNRRNLYKQDEFVQIENVQELEHTFYFTFNHLLNTNHEYDINVKELLDDIDIAIENIYENTTLNKLLEEDNEFSTIIEDIDYKYTEFRDNYLSRKYCTRYLDKFERFSQMIGDFMRVSNLALLRYHGLNEFIDGSDSDSDSDSDEDKQVKEKVNPETGEKNPNLIYSDDELSDSNDDNNDNEKKK